jgi:hypothetical protein
MKKNEGLEDRLWQNSKIIARLASKWKKEADRLKQQQHQANKWKTWRKIQYLECKKHINWKHFKDRKKWNPNEIGWGKKNNWSTSSRLEFARREEDLRLKD